jgi:hypothetical protein
VAAAVDGGGSGVSREIALLLKREVPQVSFITLPHLEEVEHPIAMDPPQPPTEGAPGVVGKFLDATHEVKPDQLNQFRRVAPVAHLRFSPSHQHRMIPQEELLPRLAIIPSLNFFQQ